MKLLGLPAKRSSHPRDEIRRGFPTKALRALAGALEMPAREQAALFGMSPATLARKRKSETPLGPEASERVYRVGSIFALAQQVFEETGRARRWLRQPNRALRGESPLQVLDTDVGAREVESLLLRIEYGTYG